MLNFVRRETIAHVDQFGIATAAFVSDTSQMWIPFFTIFSDHSAVVESIFSKKFLGIGARIDVDLRQCVVNARIVTTVMNARFEPRQQQFHSTRTEAKFSMFVQRAGLSPISFFHFFDQFVDVEIAPNRQNQLFDLIFAAIDVE